MELIIIAIFLGVIAGAEVCAIVLNIRIQHLAEELRTAERAALTHAENATTTHKQMIQNESFYRRRIDELCAKVIELTEALEEAKKSAKDIQ